MNSAQQAERTLSAHDAVAQASTLGRTLVVVPHPDDETLGCGGLLALLAQAGMPLLVVLVSDGAASHPNSRSHPAPQLRLLRWREMLAALSALGLGSAPVWPMGLPDGAVPVPGDQAFGACVERFIGRARNFRPQTVLLPWRHDEHPDHRASHAIAWAACERAAPQSRRLEYTVWPPNQEPPAATHDAAAWQIAVDSVLGRKRRALEAHGSQLGHTILDDPAAFVLPARLLARCSAPVETYFDTTPQNPP